VLLDRDREIVQRLSDVISMAVRGDGTDIAVLSEAGFRDCNAAVVAIGTNMEASILATMSLKELQIPYIVAKAASDLHGKVLDRVGADLVVYPNRERAQRLARSLLAPSMLDYFHISEGASVVEMNAPVDFSGKSLSELRVRQAHRITVLAIKRPGTDGSVQQIISPGAEEVIQAGDTLVLFGPNDQIEKLSS